MLSARREMQFIDSLGTFSDQGALIGRRQLLLNYRAALVRWPSRNDPKVEAMVLNYVDCVIEQELRRLRLLKRGG
jgi:hypothetical protein